MSNARHGLVASSATISGFEEGLTLLLYKLNRAGLLRPGDEEKYASVLSDLSAASIYNYLAFLELIEGFDQSLLLERPALLTYENCNFILQEAQHRKERHVNNLRGYIESLHILTREWLFSGFIVDQNGLDWIIKAAAPVRTLKEGEVKEMFLLFHENGVNSNYPYSLSLISLALSAPAGKHQLYAETLLQLLAMDLLSEEKIMWLQNNFTAMRALVWITKKMKTQCDEENDLIRETIKDILDHPEDAKYHFSKIFSQQGSKEINDDSLVFYLDERQDEYNEKFSPRIERLCDWYAENLDRNSGIAEIEDLAEKCEIRKSFSQPGITSISDAIHFISNPDNMDKLCINKEEQRYLLGLFIAIGTFEWLGSIPGGYPVNYIRESFQADDPTKDKIKILHQFLVFGRKVELQATLPLNSVPEDFFQYQFKEGYTLWVEVDGELHGFCFHGEFYKNSAERIQVINRLCKTLCYFWNFSAENGNLMWFLQQIKGGPCIEAATRSVFAIFAVAVESGNPELVPAELVTALSFYYQAAEAFADFFGLPKTFSLMKKLIFDAYRGKIHLKKFILANNLEESWCEHDLVDLQEVEDFLNIAIPLEDKVDVNEIKKMDAFLRKATFEENVTAIKKLYSLYITPEMGYYPWHHPFFETFLKHWRKLDSELDAKETVEFLAKTGLLNSRLYDNVTPLVHAIFSQRSDMIEEMLKQKGLVFLDEELDVYDDDQYFFDAFSDLAIITYNVPESIERLAENFASLCQSSLGQFFLIKILENNQTAQQAFKIFLNNIPRLRLSGKEETKEKIFYVILPQATQYSCRLVNLLLQIFPEWGKKVDWNDILEGSISSLLPHLLVEEINDEVNLKEALKFLTRLLELDPSFSVAGADALFWYDKVEQMSPVVSTAFSVLCQVEEGHRIQAKFFRNSSDIAEELSSEVLCGMSNSEEDNCASTASALFWLCASGSGRELFMQIIRLCPQHIASIVTPMALERVVRNGPFANQSAASVLLAAKDQVSQEIIETLVTNNPNLATVFRKKTVFVIQNEGLFQSGRHPKRKDREDDNRKDDKRQKTTSQVSSMRLQN